MADSIDERANKRNKTQQKRYRTNRYATIHRRTNSSATADSRSRPEQLVANAIIFKFCHVFASFFMLEEKCITLHSKNGSKPFDSPTQQHPIYQSEFGNKHRKFSLFKKFLEILETVTQKNWMHIQFQYIFIAVGWFSTQFSNQFFS